MPRAWRAVARIGQIGLGPHDLPEAARQAVDALTDIFPGSGWLLTQADPVSGAEYPLASAGGSDDGRELELRTEDGRLSGHVTVRLAPADADLLESPGLALLLDVLAGLVDWMHGPIWMTSHRPPGEHAAIVADTGRVVPIPGRDPGRHLRSHSPLAQIVAQSRPEPHKIIRFWWRDDTGAWHRLVVNAGPQGCLATMNELPLPYDLSAREVEVITLVATGLSNAQIARRLFITDSTVAKHVERAMRKTDSATRAVVAARATYEGLAMRPLPGG